MSYNDYTAPKYDPKLSREDIKARILADLKAAVASGDLPACKPTLREGTGVGTLSITVTLRDLAVPALRPEYVRYECGAGAEPEPYPGRWRNDSRHTEAAVKALARAEEIAGAYNFDKSDIQTDYFHVGYYLHVQLDPKQLAAETEAIICGASQRRALATKEMRSFATVARDMACERGKEATAKSLLKVGPVYDPSRPVWQIESIDRMDRKLGAELRATLDRVAKTPEDWDALAGETAQRALYAAREVVAVPAGGGTPPRANAKVVTLEGSVLAEKRRAAALKAVATRRANAQGKAVAS